jgi:RNA polymerase sigma-70 factor (ECF subfamily)
LVSRARKHISDGRRTPANPAEQRRLLDAFIGAAQGGDVSALEGLLASDVTSYADGGGLVRAAQTPVTGRERVAKFLAAISSHFWSGVTVSVVAANGQPCMLMARDGVAVALASIATTDRGIDQILWVMRPSKLSFISLQRPAPGDVPPLASATAQAGVPGESA